MKKKAYFILEESRAILGYAETPIPHSIEMIVDEEILDPEVFNHYFINENKELVKMTDEEFNLYRPYYYKPALSVEQILQAQNKVLQEQNKQLEDCIVEMANIIYQ